MATKPKQPDSLQDALQPAPISVVFEAPAKIWSALTGDMEEIQERYVLEYFPPPNQYRYRLFGQSVGTILFDADEKPYLRQIGQIKKEPYKETLMSRDLRKKVLKLLEKGKAELANKETRHQEISGKAANRDPVTDTDEENLSPTTTEHFRRV